ncbi:hypothetical protein [Microbacterium candidum]|uniref:DUF1795 domain-containing protein n=1 Tax=Microbacterium candidum TaxID=3041922 RepID=A0ABT7MUT5_9MICO|nr:hypothetical protein [Microbacterium sp. ASV49]MDL9978216.1 hypothetical protein [Microbacterium sp. ASV49]
MSARLQLRLPGEWFALDPRDEETAAAQIAAIARDVAGTADDAAIARARVRETFGEVVRSAREAEAEKVLVCREIAGMPIPASITVHLPDGMRMSPAIGTSSAAVIETLEAAFRELDVEGIDDATRLGSPGGDVLRLLTTGYEAVEEEGERLEIHRLRADYWYAVPGTKDVLLVSMTTALGDIPNLMVQFFDAIATAAYFEPEAA